ncbi:amidase [Agarivorans gilvus]|uniref:Amidase n=1 Tax=Agarivorans gilvus TaxID=680279 RepID=A0ABQ1HXS7_9ALTE|nr:amidase [Agarivorans gilvus]GGA97332.1 amidase [Agarivorans gilvus]
MATPASVEQAPLWRLSLAQLSQGFSSGQFTPSQICEQVITAIEQQNPSLNAYIYLNPQLLSQAEQSTQRWQQRRPLSPVDGIPLAVKDNLHVAGMPTSWGNASLAKLVQPSSEYCVAQCQQAGMLIIGKTNLPEFASDGITSNPHFGSTCNPWDRQLTPGGSSGGSVAAVASGLAPCALGTDGGGSIRRPCAHTGLYGLKPTAELISRKDGLPRFMFDFEVAGPIARSVEDLSLLLSVIGEQDYSCALQPSPSSSLKILAVEQLQSHPVEPQICAANRQVAKQLKHLGHHVETAALPLDLDFFNQFWPILAEVGLAFVFDELPEVASSSQTKYQHLANQGGKYSAVDIMRAWQQVLLFRQQVKQLFKHWDIVLMPSIAALAWPLEQAYPSTIAGQAVGPRGHAAFTGWVNMAGNPALNVPVRPCSSSTPIGLQLIADWHQEARLLRLAAQLEALQPKWAWPPLPQSKGGK